MALLGFNGNMLNLTGRIFGRLTTISPIKRNGVSWLCQCECGKEIVVRAGDLKNKHTQSCGCLKTSKIGPLHHSWQGGHTTKDGYTVFRQTYHGRRCYPILVHRVNAERALGRELLSGEIVHHINGNRGDNRNCNLLICTLSYHRWLEAKMSTLYKQEHFGGI